MGFMATSKDVLNSLFLKKNHNSEEKVLNNTKGCPVPEAPAPAITSREAGAKEYGLKIVNSIEK
jgi:hypothetical protein